MSISSSEIVFFFGAGASAPFGIPTMKQFVTDFETLLAENASKDEQLTYRNIKEILEKRMKREVDLEAVFTVIDGILNYNIERLSLLSLYCATEFNPPNAADIEICSLLKRRFQTFVKEKCVIPEESFPKIAAVYHDFFNRFALELGGEVRHGAKYAYCQTWSIFTTNYDLCLESYWRGASGIGIDTGFEFNRQRNVNVLRAPRLLQENAGIQLFKLHGSVDWLIEKGTNDVLEVETVKVQSHLGRKYEGEMMIYPIAEKELYADPYISMLLRLNRELERRSVWVVIGYSFNDPIIREVFIRRSSGNKRLLLVHPDANSVWKNKVSLIKGTVHPIQRKFGLDDSYRQVNHQIIHNLKKDLEFGENDFPDPERGHY
jgi:hypothetical protein